MQVLNIHKRVINQPRGKVWDIVKTLSSKEDQIWPTEKWPRMRLNRGLEVGSSGGHGPIRYVIQEYLPGELIQFKFLKPKGFIGKHTIELTKIEENITELKHTIHMKTSLSGMFIWSLAIRSLHDALMEDAFDKVENHFSKNTKKQNGIHG